MRCQKTCISIDSDPIENVLLIKILEDPFAEVSYDPLPAESGLSILILAV
ncbi:MAG: hypothetical protein ABIQ95_03795 [Bdellovibrionia bacterium]